MAFVFAIPEAVLRGLYLNFRFLFKEGNPPSSESQTNQLGRSYLFLFYRKIANIKLSGTNNFDPLILKRCCYLQQI